MSVVSWTVCGVGHSVWSVTRNAFELLSACELESASTMCVGFETGAVLIKVPAI